MALTKKKKFAALGAAVVLVASGGAAYAFWTTGGSGTGSATTGTSTDFTVAVNPLTSPPLTPGGAVDTYNVTVTNPSTGIQHLSGLTVTKDSVSGAGAGGCTTADYAITTPTVVASDVAAGGTYTTGAFTVSMINDPANNQDGCKTAVLHFTVNAS
ncbi:MAG: hypothetical protein JWO46_165 [Nocardioidaceae bacterium]|nr:hypothetical protein [Nocardioidaceae bacterium]